MQYTGHHNGDSPSNTLDLIVSSGKTEENHTSRQADRRMCICDRVYLKTQLYSAFLAIRGNCIPTSGAGSRVSLLFDICSHYGNSCGMCRTDKRIGLQHSWIFTQKSNMNEFQEKLCFVAYNFANFMTRAGRTKYENLTRLIICRRSICTVVCAFFFFWSPILNSRLVQYAQEHR